MASGWTITGTVRGNILFPNHPEHEGAWGLVGGEDIYAARRRFRSPGEAMTWCRNVLDGLTHPRNWDAAGDLLTPHTQPRWFEAEVRATPVRGSVDVDDQTWIAAGPHWHERTMVNGQERLGPTVRTDRRAATTETIAPSEEYL